MQNVLEQGPDFGVGSVTQFLYNCIHTIHAKMFSIQILLHFSQIVQRVCTLVLFIVVVSSIIRVVAVAMSLNSIVSVKQ